MLSVMCLYEVVLNYSYSFQYRDMYCTLLVPVVKDSEGEGTGPRARGESAA